MKDTRFAKRHQASESASIGWFFLGLFIPLVGLVLFLAWYHDHHKKAVRAGVGALCCLIISVLIGLATLVFSINMIKTASQANHNSVSSSYSRKPHQQSKHATPVRRPSDNASQTASISSESASAESYVPQSSAKSSSITSKTSERRLSSSSSSSSMSLSSSSNSRVSTHQSFAPSSASSVQSSTLQTYTVQANDNLYRIAVAHGMTLSELLQLNGLSSGANISAGQVLKVSH